ncbi:spore germination protein, partial [Paenibacillus larvae]
YMVCKQLVTHTKIIYLHKTPLVFLILPLLFLVFLIAKSGIQTIAICSGILYPLMFIFQMIAIFGNIPYVNLSMFTPVLENGIAGVWNALPWSISGFLDFLFLWVLISHFSEKDNNKTFMGVLILSGIVVLFVTVASVLIFGPFGAVTQRFPIFEQWRLVMISKYVEHVDFLFMFIRLSASMMRSVLCIYLSAGMVRWTSPSYRAWYLGGICALLFVLLLVPESDPHFVMASRKVYIPLIMFSSLIVLIVLWLLTFRRVEENM